MASAMLHGLRLLCATGVVLFAGDGTVGALMAQSSTVGTKYDAVILARSEMRRFRIVISGDPQPFRARCVIVDHSGARKRISFDGKRPKAYGLTAVAVDCTVDRVAQRAGPLTVELFTKGSSLPLGQNTSTDAFGCVRVRSDGPWGSAFGRRCSRVTPFFGKPSGRGK